jgi:hypothetical protein
MDGCVDDADFISGLEQRGGNGQKAKWSRGLDARKGWNKEDDLLRFFHARSPVLMVFRLEPHQYEQGAV